MTSTIPIWASTLREIRWNEPLSARHQCLHRLAEERQARCSACGASRRGHIFLCAPVKAELWFGACKSRRVTENQERLQQFFDDLPSLPFDDASVRHFGEIRATLARQGQPIGPYDLQIAAIARAHNLTVITNNTGGFSRVPGVTTENWQRG